MDVRARGLRFNCRIDGPDGAPWVVFSNSLLTNLSMWDDQVAGLADRFRILRYDQRGHGGTEAPVGPYRFDELARDIVALCDALRIGTTHVVGLSMGGVTAVTLAAARPDRVGRVVACDCGPGSTPQSAQQWSERIALARDRGMEALVEITVARWFPPEFLGAQPAVVDRVREMIRSTPLEGFAGGAAALSNFDLRPLLGGVRAPVQFICGAKDAALPGTKALHAGVPGSRFAEVPGAGHISNLEQPALFTRIVRDFLTA